MAVHIPNMSDVSPGERAAAIQQAGSVVTEGGLVLSACESAYLLIAGADTIAGLAGLRRMRDPGGLTRPAWLAPGVATAERVLAAGGVGGVSRRLLRRLAPGPAVFRLGMDEAGLEGVRRALKVGPEAVDQDGALWVRVPDDSPALSLAMRRGPTLAAIEVFEPDGRLCMDVEAAQARVRDAGLELGAMLGVSGISVKAGASVIAIGGGPGRAINASVGIVRPGAYEERFVRKMVKLNILFVCTGNTCRSPMAEAIAAGLLAERGVSSEQVHVESAGVGAAAGAPAASDTAGAVRALGFDAACLARHASRPLTRNMIDDADAIFAMTSGHAAAVRSMHPGAGGKVEVLDPAGADVPDPIGMGQETYNQTARRLKDLIQRRLGELSV